MKKYLLLLLVSAMVALSTGCSEPVPSGEQSKSDHAPEKPDAGKHKDLGKICPNCGGNHDPAEPC